MISSNQFIDPENIDVMLKGAKTMTTSTIEGKISMLMADAETIMTLVNEVGEPVQDIP